MGEVLSLGCRGKLALHLGWACSDIWFPVFPDHWKAKEILQWNLLAEYSPPIQAIKPRSTQAVFLMREWNWSFRRKTVSEIWCSLYVRVALNVPTTDRMVPPGPLKICWDFISWWSLSQGSLSLTMETAAPVSNLKCVSWPSTFTVVVEKSALLL